MKKVIIAILLILCLCMLAACSGKDDYAAREEWESEEYAGSLHQYKIDRGEDTVLFDVKDSIDIHDLYVTEQNQIKILYNSYTEVFGVIRYILKYRTERMQALYHSPIILTLR